jgi:D-beta-D-heptose 7-phosphate kinase/D-beta-D-heptose 1-phosphate adenosyltransferase
VTDYSPGGAANVALNVRSLGGVPLLLGAVGRDYEGARLRRLLDQSEIETVLIEDAQRPTTVKTRLVAQSQQIARVDRESREPLDSTCTTELVSRLERAIEGADALVLSDYGKGVLVPAIVRPALTTAARSAVPVVVDPKNVRLPEYEGATVLTPNRNELAHLIGREHADATDEEALIATARSVLAELALEAIVITCGPDGMILVEGGSPAVAIPAHTREAYDSTGAGDTVAAAMGLGLAAGLPLHESAHLASAAAGVVVTKAGTAAVSKNELLAAADEQEHLDARPLSADRW